MGVGKFELVPKGFPGCRELELLVAFVGRGELVPPLEIVGSDKFGLLVGVVGFGEFVGSLGIVGFGGLGVSGGIVGFEGFVGFMGCDGPDGSLIVVIFPGVVVGPEGSLMVVIFPGVPVGLGVSIGEAGEEMDEGKGSARFSNSSDRPDRNG